MIELELEKTYLARSLPEGLASCPHTEVADLYIPAIDIHPVLRIRKKGDKLEITKKQPVVEGDASEQSEHTIRLTHEEYTALTSIKGKAVRKIRYAYPYNGLNAEFDVFKDALEGLVLVDFEFKSPKDKNSFQIPDFCLVDVTQDDAFAGGMICGKSYSDIKAHVEELGYKPLYL